MAGPVTITGIQGIPEIQAGDDLGAIIVAAARAQRLDLAPDDGAIVLKRDPQAPVANAEGYALDVTPQGIRITARDERGSVAESTVVVR